MAQCRDNSWQPTFVHDIDRPEPNGAPYYVMPNNQGFLKLMGNTVGEWIAHARQLIQAHGVRDSRGYTRPEEYNGVQCGCQRGVSEGNSTCAQFLAGR
jgi:hypothetical protein